MKNIVAWIPGDDNTYSRPCGPMERAYAKMVHSTKRFGREDFVVEYVLKFTEAIAARNVKSMKQRLHNAWRALRFEHPMVAVELSEDEQTLQYRVPDQAALERWLAQTFIVHEREVRPAGKTFADLKPPHLMELHFFPNTMELLLRSSHWRIDGAGCSLLMDHFFDILGDPSSDAGKSSLEWGRETSRLPLAIEDALELPLDVPREAQQWGGEWMTDFISAAPSIGLHSQPSDAPGRPSRELLELSKKDTAALVSGCKAVGITVTAALHAAVIIQTRNMTEPVSMRDHKVMDVLMSDLRMYMPEP